VFKISIVVASFLLSVCGDSSANLAVFSADGYPIFGPYFDDNGTIRKAASSFQVIGGSSPSGTGSPGGNYRDDYKYVVDYGDLD
jgi:hypothetical protein